MTGPAAGLPRLAALALLLGLGLAACDDNLDTQANCGYEVGSRSRRRAVYTDTDCDNQSKNKEGNPLDCRP